MLRVFLILITLLLALPANDCGGEAFSKEGKEAVVHGRSGETQTRGELPTTYLRTHKPLTFYPAWRPIGCPVISSSLPIFLRKRHLIL